MVVMMVMMAAVVILMVTVEIVAWLWKSGCVVWLELGGVARRNIATDRVW